MRSFEYLFMSKEQFAELNKIFKKYFPYEQICWGYDSFENEIYFSINHNYYFCFPFLNDFKNIDLAVDYNVFFAKIFGKSYMNETKKELKFQINALDLSNKNDLAEYKYLKELDKKLIKEYKNLNKNMDEHIL